MKRGEINDLGLGICGGACKQWKELPSYHIADKNKPRKERRRVCTACYAQQKRESDPFYFVKRAISAHKSMAGECDFDLRDIKSLQQWQAFKCPYCSEPIHYDFTLEHIVPRIQGGRNKLTNILLICTCCNSSKQDFELVYWLDVKGYKVKPKILHKIKGAYDDHGFQIGANCSHCYGSKNTAVCTSSPTSPGKYCLYKNG